MTRRRLLVIVLACLVVCGGCGGSRPGRPPARVTQPAARPATGRGSVAARFAAAYVRFLDGAGRAGALPNATTAVRRLAAQAGPVPASRRRGTLVLEWLRPVVGPSDAYVLAARDHAHTFYAQVSLAPRAGRWVVAQLEPPDFVQDLAPAGPQARASTGAVVKVDAVARRFLHGYLSWLYGQAPPTAIEDATPGLLAALKSHPPRIPPGMPSRHATAAAIAVGRRGGGWQALANVTDGRETYELVLTLTPTRGQWLVTRVGAPR